MEEILKTTLLEYGKSTFLLDLVKHNSGRQYIKILQTIHKDQDINIQQEIKINPSIIEEIIEVLVNYKNEVLKNETIADQFISAEDKQEIQSRFFKGVSIKDIAMQFDCPPLLIQQILENGGIEIVLNKPPHFKRYRRKKKR